MKRQILVIAIGALALLAGIACAVANAAPTFRNVFKLCHHFQMGLHRNVRI